MSTTFVLGTIQVLLNLLERYGLKVTLRAADELREFQAEAQDRSKGAALDTGQAKRLKKIIIDLEKTYRAEAKGIHTFFIAERRYSTESLTRNPESLLPPGVFAQIPELAKYDIGESGLCLAFDRPTAAAFHILRATEAILREYYCRIVKRGRIPSMLWRPILKDLESKKKRPTKATLQGLDYIRYSFRNPTAHPEARYDIEEAQAVFGLCLDSISKMVKDKLWQK